MEQRSIQLETFIHDLSEIPAKDALVSIDFEAKNVLELPDFPQEVFSLEYEGKIKSILKTAKETQRESDINTLCVIHSLITWKKNEELLHTPIALFPLNGKLHKLTSSVQFENNEKWKVNPYLKWLWKDWTGSELPIFEEVSELHRFLLDKIADGNLPLEIHKRFFIGNFHFHRYHILRELEGIQKAQNFSNPLKLLLGETIHSDEKITFTKRNLVPSDRDQTSVLNTLESSNSVVEGPPGTGKSQLLINLVGKIVEKQQTVLIVSEKKVALDVLRKKLAEHNLHHFAFSVSSQTSNKEFILALKSSWEFLELINEKLPTNLFLSENYMSNLQLLLNRLKDKNTFQGIEYTEFIDLLKSNSIEPKHFSSSVCSLSEWLEMKKIVIELDQELGDLKLLSNYKPAFFKLEKPDVYLTELHNNINLLTVLFQVSTIGDIKKLENYIGRAQLLDNELYELYSQFIDKPKHFKNFEKKVHKLRELENCFHTLKTELSIWKTIPSKIELESWKSNLSYFQKRRTRKNIEKLLSRVGISQEIALKELSKFYELKTELEEVQSFFIRSGFSTTSTILDVEYLFVKRLLAEDSAVFSELLSWKKETRNELLVNATLIQQVNKQLSNYFFFEPDVQLLQEITLKRNSFDQLLTNWSTILTLPFSFFRSLQKNSNWKELETFIVHSNWKLIQANTPELSKFAASDFSKKLNLLLAEQKTEFDWFAKHLISIQRSHFNSNEKLLQTTTAKLSSLEKGQKNRLKKGKSILVNEFSKSRSHKSIRELLSSEAKEWITCLLPVWLSTPSQVADHFPLERELFDWSLFDEASQIPLPNAFGSLYRSKRTLVAGDQQQMSPTTYFGKKYAFSNLMHQSSYYFTKLNLSYHYRSVNPDLIRFSNRHFYENQLHVFPTANKQKAVFHHFFPEGRYIERKNELEAKAVANFLDTYNWKKSLGLVAFSEEQLSCILNYCSPKTLEKLDEAVEENFAFVKALDKVQGDEADVLVISFGYGKNENGDFAQRFGPVNHSDGHKRLNVLFSRAKEELHFFSSVNSEDFTLSENESVNLLRKWFIGLDELKKDNLLIDLPFPLDFEMTNTELKIKNVSSTLSDANDLLTFHSVILQRGWKLIYE